MKTDEIPGLLDKSELLIRIDRRLASLERDTTLLASAYQRMACQIGGIAQTIAECPPTCPHRINPAEIAE